jgi:hypothetical protein
MEFAIYLILSYLIFSYYVGYKIYKANYYFFHDLKDDDGKDIHLKYPEFKRYDKNRFTILRIVLFMPFAILRLIFIAFLIIGLWISLR